MNGPCLDVLRLRTREALTKRSSNGSSRQTPTKRRQSDERLGVGRLFANLAHISER